MDEQVYGDFHQFFSQLMADGGLIANELPENEYNGFQLNTALALFVNKLNVLQTKILNINNWNLYTSGGGTGSATKSIAHGLTLSKIITFDVIIRTDTDNSRTMGPVQAIGNYADATNINLSFGSGGFNTTAYSNDSGYIRGYIVIKYLP